MKRVKTKKKDRPPSLGAAALRRLGALWFGGGGGPTVQIRREKERAWARARLRTRLPPRLLKDLGLWDD